MCLILLLAISLGVVSANNEVELNIDPGKIVYLEQQSPFSIICETGKTNITSVEWISINKHRFGHTFPFVSFIKNRVNYEWGSHFQNFSERIHVTGTLSPVTDSFLQLEFQKVKCEDEAQYECVIEGRDENGVIWEYRASEELIVYSTHGKPQIKVDTKRIPNNEMTVKPGKEITLSCEGSTGRPPVPLYWYKYEQHTGQYKHISEGVGQASRTVPVDDLCHYHIEQPLTYTVTENELEVTFKCRIGYYEEIFTIFVDLQKNHDTLEGSKRRANGMLANVQTNGCHVKMGLYFIQLLSTVLVAIILYRNN